MAALIASEKVVGRATDTITRIDDCEKTYTTVGKEN